MPRLEAKVLRIERDGTGDILDLIADAVNLLDERMGLGVLRCRSLRRHGDYLSSPSGSAR
jgi:hypothetical protein